MWKKTLPTWGDWDGQQRQRKGPTQYGRSELLQLVSLLCDEQGGVNGRDDVIDALGLARLQV